MQTTPTGAVVLTYDDPGDLSRRLVCRRQALGLTGDDVARRAGMDPGYLDYLEGRADASPSQATLGRLAAVLDTSVAALRGGGLSAAAVRPDVAGRADRRGG